MKISTGQNTLQPELTRRSVLFLLRRNPSNLLSSESKSCLYRSNINPTLVYASECWSANKSNAHLIENFNRKVLRRVSPGLSYRDSLLKNNLLPPLYFQVPKDLFLFSKILNDDYDVFPHAYYITVNDSRWKRIVLPTIKYEMQRQDFRYRTAFRTNVIRKHMDFYNPTRLKPSLPDMMWKYFNTHWSESNSCSWTCICTNCRQRPWTI